MLQSESVDDDIEHFEDIVESTDNPAISSTMPDKHNDILATQKYNSDTEGGSDNINQVKLVAGDEKDETNASTNGSTLHALYNPRHREPSYWYCLFNLIFFAWIFRITLFKCKA